MPINKIYKCEPCNFEHEYIDFGLGRNQKPVPPCPLCSNELTYEQPEILEEYNYQCWKSEGGCGIPFSVEHLVGKAPETYSCPICKTPAKLKQQFAIVHGKTTTKGASLDVAIGRSAEEKWGKIHDRKAVRDKIRIGAGTQALTATGINEYKPIKDAQLKAVTVPQGTVNKGE